MSVLQHSIPFGVAVEQALSWAGALALKEGNAEAAHGLAVLVHAYGPTEVTVHVSVVHVLCQMADEFRRRGDAEAVAQLERVVALLKTAPREIVGTMLLSGARGLAKLDDQYETLRRIVAAGG